MRLVPDTPEQELHEARTRAREGALLGPRELMLLLGLKQARFYELQKAGIFDGLKVKIAVGPRCYSGEKVDRLLRGEEVYAISFGGRRHRRA